MIFFLIRQLQDTVSSNIVSEQTSTPKTVNKIDPFNADPEYVSKVKQILKYFSDLVTSSNRELGRTGLIQHTIDTQ